MPHATTQRRSTLRFAIALALAVAPAVPAQAPLRDRVLFLTHSAGFTHDVVKRAERAVMAFAEKELTEAAGGWCEVVATQDCGAITAKNLAGFRAVVFYTTGELPIDAAGQAALFEFVKNGGGFVGVHSATDTFYKVPEYGAMIGGYFNGHPWHEKVRVKVDDRAHPATAHLGESFEITDEIYQYKDFLGDKLHVLLSLDPASVDIKKGTREDGRYALAWCRELGKGRVFYTALGHRPEVWKDERFRRHLMCGMRWAMDGGNARSAPPAGARVLFDGKTTQAWRHKNGDACAWSVADGTLEVTPGKGDLVSKEPVADCRIHLEFRQPTVDVDAHDGNSGLYIQGRYEVQIIDAAAKVTADKSCGALYGARAPDVNACRPRGEWQGYDVWFEAARFADGKKTGDARITVFWNGVLVHDRVALSSKTGAGAAEGPEPGSIVLQDHGTKVRFRNVWVAPAR